MFVNSWIFFFSWKSECFQICGLGFLSTAKIFIIWWLLMTFVRVELFSVNVINYKLKIFLNFGRFVMFYNPQFLESWKEYYNKPRETSFIDKKINKHLLNWSKKFHLSPLKQISQLNFAKLNNFRIKNLISINNIKDQHMPPHLINCIWAKFSISLAYHLTRGTLWRNLMQN